MLGRGAPYPQVILPQFGGYWIEEPPSSVDSSEDDRLPGDYGYELEDVSEAARAYRKHFLGRVRAGKLHFTIIARIGTIVASVWLPRLPQS